MITLNRLVWDDFNVEHIAQHGVRSDEVEEVFLGVFVLLEGKKGRLLVFGQTWAGRLLTVVLATIDPEKGWYYAVTARPSARKEREYYEEHFPRGEQS